MIKDEPAAREQEAREMLADALDWKDRATCLDFIDRAAGGLLSRISARVTVVEALRAITAALSRATTAELALAEVTRERNEARRRATDHLYMMGALVNMLGPNGRKVWDQWQATKVQRVHYSWGPDADQMTGEDRAAHILKLEEALKDAVPIDDVDALLSKGEAGHG